MIKIGSLSELWQYFFGQELILFPVFLCVFSISAVQHQLIGEILHIVFLHQLVDKEKHGYILQALFRNLSLFLMGVLPLEMIPLENKLVG